MCFQLATSIFFITEKQSENKIQGFIMTMRKLKVMSKSVNNVVLCHVTKISGLQKSIYLWSFIQGTSTEGPAASSSSPAPSEILSLGVLRSIVAPAKS